MSPWKEGLRKVSGRAENPEKSVDWILNARNSKELGSGSFFLAFPCLMVRQSASEKEGIRVRTRLIRRKWRAVATGRAPRSN